MKKVKTEKKGLSMREKLLARKKELEKKGSGGGMIYPKKEPFASESRIQVKIAN